MSAWPSIDAQGRPGVSPCARTSPAARCRPRSSAAGPAASSANWRSGARGSATGSWPFARAVRQRRDRRHPGDRPAGALRSHDAERLAEAVAGVRRLAARRQRQRAAELSRRARRPAAGRAGRELRDAARRRGARQRGRHRVQVLATDIFGQSMLTPASTLRVDGTPPTVKIARTAGGHAVSVRIRDPNSGVAKADQRQLRRRPPCRQAGSCQPSLCLPGDLHDRRSRPRSDRKPGDRAPAGERAMRRSVLACRGCRSGLVALLAGAARPAPTSSDRSRSSRRAPSRELAQRTGRLRPRRGDLRRWALRRLRRLVRGSHGRVAARSPDRGRAVGRRRKPRRTRDQRARCGSAVDQRGRPLRQLHDHRPPGRTERRQRRTRRVCPRHGNPGLPGL